MTDTSLALFDFDGTLCKIDSFTAFFRFLLPKHEFYLKCCPISLEIAQYFLGYHPAHDMRPTLFKALCKNKKLDDLTQKIDVFVKNILQHQLNTETMRRLEWHKQQGHQIYIVSAGLDLYLSSIAKSLDVPVICTKIEVIEGHITGEYTTPDCSHDEKVRRIQECIPLDHFDQIYAYGNSAEDFALLRLAHHPYWIDRQHRLIALTH